MMINAGDFTALDQRLQQLSVRNPVVTTSSHNSLHLLDQLTAQQEKNQLALLQLQQQMHEMSASRSVRDATECIVLFSAFLLSWLQLS